MAKKKYVIADTNIIIEIIKNKEEKIDEIFIDLMYEFSLSYKLSIPDALIASTSLLYKALD